MDKPNEALVVFSARLPRSVANLVEELKYDLRMPKQDVVKTAICELAQRSKEKGYLGAGTEKETTRLM